MKMPSRIETIALDGNWEGWEFTLRLSIKVGEFERLEEVTQGASHVEAVRAMVSFLVERLIGWNFEDEEGRPIPLDAEGVRSLTVDLLALCFTRALRRVGAVPLAPAAS